VYWKADQSRLSLTYNIKTKEKKVIYRQTYITVHYIEYIIVHQKGSWLR